MESNENVTSACKRPWHGADGYLRVCTSTSSNVGRRGAGPHGSTPSDRLATSAVSLARAKAAQTGFPRRGRPRPRKPGSSFGRWSPLVGLGHKSRRTHSLKGIVPEVAAHVWCCWALPVAVAASRNHTRLQLLLQLACDVCSRWLVRGVDAERIFAGAWQRLWPYGGSEYVKAIDVRAVRAVQVS